MRGDHLSAYDQDAREQIQNLCKLIDLDKALNLWNTACGTSWKGLPVWIHGDFAVGNMLSQNNRLSAVIDFGGTAIGDPACDLVIAWTYFAGKSREIFIQTMNLDQQTWLRARGWALWKATYELCQAKDKSSPEAMLQKQIIHQLIEQEQN